MRLYLVSDSPDAVAGLRLAGVEGTLVPDAAAARETVLRLSRDPEIGVVLITRGLLRALGGFPTQFRAAHLLPVLVETPDTGGQPPVGTVADYVRDAIGIG